MTPPTNEDIYKQLLLSEKWDVRNAPATRLRYAIFSLPRTGSELLCARLRLAGIGVPCEYFNTQAVAARLGCLDDAGGVDVMKYLERLEAVRTTLNGIFGTKLQPRHLANASGGDAAIADRLLRRFDKIVVLRRRDVLLQAISLARSHLTGQWHVLPGDDTRHIAADDGRLFDAITAGLERIRRADAALHRLERARDAGSVQSVYYEDMTQGGVCERLIDWIADGFDRLPLPAEHSPDHALPQRGDASEAAAIKERYLSAIKG
jgi:LPS sulfotransferase NodH